jgi:hypothetical protein
MKKLIEILRSHPACPAIYVALGLISTIVFLVMSIPEGGLPAIIGIGFYKFLIKHWGYSLPIALYALTGSGILLEAFLFDKEWCNAQKIIKENTMAGGALILSLPIIFVAGMVPGALLWVVLLFCIPVFITGKMAQGLMSLGNRRGRLEKKIAKLEKQLNGMTAAFDPEKEACAMKHIAECVCDGRWE